MQVVTANFARKLERERDETREAFVIATDQMVVAQCKLRESNKERDELTGAIKSMRKNAREDAGRIQGARLLVKQLVLQIEHPAYSVDEAIGKMILMDDAKKFINEV
jgi:hypothetical protein